MKPYLLAAILTLCSFNVFSQSEPGNASDLPEHKLNLTAKGSKIYLNGARLSHKKVKAIYENYPEAASVYRSAKTVDGFNYVIAVVSGACIGWELGRLASTGEVNPATLGVGGGLLVVCIALQTVTNKKLAQSVHIYNKSKPTVVHFEYGVLGSGVGVCMKF